MRLIKLIMKLAKPATQLMTHARMLKMWANAMEKMVTPKYASTVKKVHEVVQVVMVVMVMVMLLVKLIMKPAKPATELHKHASLLKIWANAMKKMVTPKCASTVKKVHEVVQVQWMVQLLMLIIKLIMKPATPATQLDKHASLLKIWANAMKKMVTPKRASTVKKVHEVVQVQWMVQLLLK